MSPFESILIALEAIFANRLRSGLTMLGLIFGVGAVIAAVSMTEGAKQATLERFKMFGTNTLTVRPGHRDHGAVRGATGSQNSLTMEDADAILREVGEVVAVAPQVQGRAQVDAGGNNTNTSVIGTTAADEKAESYRMMQGSFFTDTDVERNRKVAVIGPTVANNVYGAGADVVGRRIRIAGGTFRVVGEFASRGGMGFRDPDDQILIPITAALMRIPGAAQVNARGQQSVNAVVMQLRTMGDSTDAQGAITELLRTRHRTRKGDPDDFMIMSNADIIQGAEEANRILTMLFGSIAAVSLVVGGIGIMNIMLVSVTERTREIGLRKAVGARPKDIMVQFLIESVTLSMAGGLVGVAIGVLAAPVATHLGINAKVSITWVGIAFSFAAAVGIVFGILPARKAANLDPVEALRYE